MKKEHTITNLFFSEYMLVNIKKNEIFEIDNSVDFFSLNGSIFIIDQKNFEILLNFRESMIKKKVEIVKEFAKLGLFVDATEILEIVGENTKRLRKLAKVQSYAYYKNPTFLKQLENANRMENWGLEYKNNKINITKDNIDAILSILSNSRLKSPINEESFDVGEKEKLAKT